MELVEKGDLHTPCWQLGLCSTLWGSWQSPNFLINLQDDRRNDLWMKMVVNLCSGYSRPDCVTKPPYDFTEAIQTLGLVFSPGISLFCLFKLQALQAEWEKLPTKWLKEARWTPLMHPAPEGNARQLPSREMLVTLVPYRRIELEGPTLVTPCSCPPLTLAIPDPMLLLWGEAS